MDRIELGNQSFLEYQGFAEDSETVNDTTYTSSLVKKLKSSDQDEVLIITSIQKMSNIKEEEVQYRHAIDIIRKKRLVFIIDECHRNTFGEMLLTIKNTFPKAIFFGFTGTPIHDENQKRHNTTATVFGDELHRYSIADGIRDKNVLGFDPVKVCTYSDGSLCEVVALEKAHVSSVKEIFGNEEKERIYYHYLQEVPMAGHSNDDGHYEKGIEDYIPVSQYEREDHRRAVVLHIGQKNRILSHNGKFHSILATSSIAEAIEYYKLFRQLCPEIRVSTLYDPSIDNIGAPSTVKEDETIKMLAEYNQRYGMTFTMPKYQSYKKDVAARLAHKKPYVGLENVPKKQLDLLIVVDQMLTGYDSKWINTLYLDKVLRYEGVIQAFSRTNRLFGPDKPFGNIQYYRYPHTMERNIEAAFNLYSGNRPFGLFAEHLEENLTTMNNKFREINDLFAASGVENFERLPDSVEERAMFAKLFRQFNASYEAARIQGFAWVQHYYQFQHEDGEITDLTVALTETTYLILVLRYKELFSPGGGLGPEDDIPYEIDTYLTEINTDRIDADYMQTRFEKYVRLLNNAANEAEIYQALADLHKTFATLSREEQMYANQILVDVQQGNLILEPGKSLRDYLNEYISRAKNDRIHRFALNFGVDEDKLRRLSESTPTVGNLNEFGRFDQLVETVDKETARAFIEAYEGSAVPQRKLGIKIHSYLRAFLIGAEENLSTFTSSMPSGIIMK